MASSSSSHPNQHPFNSRRNISNSSSGSSSSPSYTHNSNVHWPNMPELFTPEMRDLQARGKDPYSTGGDLGGGGGGGRGGGMHHGHHGGMRTGGIGPGPR